MPEIEDSCVSMERMYRKPIDLFNWYIESLNQFIHLIGKDVL